MSRTSVLILQPPSTITNSPPKDSLLLFPMASKATTGSRPPVSSSTPSKRTAEPLGRRRANSFSAPSSDSVDVALRPSKSDPASTPHKLDRFGFIVNMDNDGQIREVAPAAEKTKVLAEADYKRTQRRIKKWEKMITDWESKKQSKLVIKRLRKGVPDEIRAKVWMLLTNAPRKIKENRGVYDSLVRQAIVPMDIVTDSDSPEQELDFLQTKSFLNVQEIIERDIHRTFPRHSMFYDVDEEGDSSESSDLNGVCGAAEISQIMQDLDVANNHKRKLQHREDRMSPRAVLEGKGGQASLRRLLKAYSVYDRAVGYCQGINFLCGTLLTLMSEEQAFWVFTSVMHDQPCQMHGLFGEGMSETHKVLYVAEKLIQQFLPRLYKHLEREHVHITMFATQWLLTQYTSSFHFDLVTRVWDSFLAEGWKTTYRVMLSILTQFQPALLKMGFEDILAFFRTLPDNVDGATTMDAAVKIPLRHAHIAKYETEWAAQQQPQTTTTKD